MFSRDEIYSGNLPQLQRPVNHLRHHFNLRNEESEDEFLARFTTDRFRIPDSFKAIRKKLFFSSFRAIFEVLRYGWLFGLASFWIICAPIKMEVLTLDVHTLAVVATALIVIVMV